MQLKQSTARNRVVFMTDAADHVAGKTGLTLTITASKDGGAFASITPTVTERGNGWYNLALTTAHTDTLGDFAMHITGSGADPTDTSDEVVNLPNTLGRVTNGTAQSGTTTSIVLQSGTGASITDDKLNGMTIVLTGGTGAYQATFITDWVAATNTATLDPPLIVAPSSDTTYDVWPTAGAPVTSLPEVKTKTIQDGILVANTFGADFLTAAKVAADVGTEIAAAVRTNLTTELGRIDVASSTLATAANLATVDTVVDSILANLAVVDGIVDTIVAKTNGLNFNGNNILADIEALNGTPLLGAGTAGNKWRA